MIDITVLLGDPRLPYGYNPSNRFEPQDHRTVRELQEALATLEGYRFRYVDDHERLWRVLEEDHPSLVLNFCNTGYRNEPSRQQHVSAMLEMFNLPYAGAGPESIVLCHHKYLVYTLAADLGIPVPHQVLADTSQPEACMRAVYPAFIKPNSGDGSFGITAEAIVETREDARTRLEALDALIPGQEVLIQEYLPGPEYSVGLIGDLDGGFGVLPPLQIDFSGLEPDLPPILTYQSKVDPGSPYWQEIGFRPAGPEALCKRMGEHARLICERLGCRDYARVDFRADADGEPRLLDVNAHPMWGQGGMMATMAGYRGDSYPRFLESIIEASRARLRG